MSIAFVSRPPSVHAPWRKTFIIPLWTIQLFFAAFTGILNVTLYGASIYEGTDSGANAFSERIAITVGIFGLTMMCIIIAHIVLFAHFRLTSQIFLIGNAVNVLLSAICIILTVIDGHQASQYWGYVTFVSFGIPFPSVLCFFSIWMVVYGVLVWRRVNAGRTREMSRPRSESGAGRKGLDAQENGIPMV